MSEQPTTSFKVLRAVVFIVLPAAVIPLLLAVIVVWPESQYVRIWEVLLCVVTLGGIIIVIVKQRRQR
jgi:hypothetical protein